MLPNRLAGSCSLLIGLWTVPTPRAIPLATCEDLVKATVDHGSITSAESLRPGAFKPPEGADVNVAVPFCRVTLTLKPSADSMIASEVWMPLTGWNGKF